jgi:hypothetical protein
MAWVVRSQECSQLDFVRWKQRVVDSRGSATGWTCGRPLHVLGDLNRRRSPRQRDTLLHHGGPRPAAQHPQGHAPADGVDLRPGHKNGVGGPEQKRTIVLRHRN